MSDARLSILYSDFGKPSARRQRALGDTFHEDALSEPIHEDALGESIHEDAPDWINYSLGGLKGAARSRNAWSSQTGYYSARAGLRAPNILLSDRERAGAF